MRQAISDFLCLLYINLDSALAACYSTTLSDRSHRRYIYGLNRGTQEFHLGRPLAVPPSYLAFDQDIAFFLLPSILKDLIQFSAILTIGSGLLQCRPFAAAEGKMTAALNSRGQQRRQMKSERNCQHQTSGLSRQSVIMSRMPMIILKTRIRTP